MEVVHFPSAAEKPFKYGGDERIPHKINEILKHHRKDLKSKLKNKQVAQVYSTVMSNETVLTFEEYFLSNVPPLDREKLAKLADQLRSIMVLEVCRSATLLSAGSEKYHRRTTSKIFRKVEPAPSSACCRCGSQNTPNIVIHDLNALLACTHAQQLSSTGPRGTDMDCNGVATDDSEFGDSYAWDEDQSSRVAGSSSNAVSPGQVTLEYIPAPIDLHRRSSSMPKSAFSCASVDGWRLSRSFHRHRGRPFFRPTTSAEEVPVGESVDDWRPSHRSQRHRGRPFFRPASSADDVSVGKICTKRGVKHAWRIVRGNMLGGSRQRSVDTETSLEKTAPISVDTETSLEDRLREHIPVSGRRSGFCIPVMPTASALMLALQGTTDDVEREEEEETEEAVAAK